MTIAQQMLAVMAGIFGVLVTASLVERVLSSRVADGAENATLDNLRDRINAWWAMAAIGSLAFFVGNNGVIALCALISFMALREFLTLMQTRRGDHWALFSTFFVVLPFQYYLIAIDWYGFYSIFIPVYAFLLLPVVAALRGDTERFLDRIAEVQWGLMTCVFCVSHVAALVKLEIPGSEGRNLFLVAFVILVVQASDVLQYIWGKLVGRHPIAPKLSPSKTIEGFAGGIVSATLLGAGLWWMTPFTPLQAAGMALVITIMGFSGGLVMSAIKRDRGVKDWGHALPGHGGVLDRCDSLIFAAPIFFHLTRYWFTV